MEKEQTATPNEEPGTEEESGEEDPGGEAEDKED